jgi:transposase
VSNVTFVPADLTTFCSLDGLGLVAVGQRVGAGSGIILCEVAASDKWCRECGGAGVMIGTVVRKLAHEPLGWRPTCLWVRVRRYRCGGCGRVWRQDTSRAAEPRAKISRAGLRWALYALVVSHMSMSRVAAGLGVAWHTANNAVLAEGERLLFCDPARFDQVEVIGVDEHVWRHSRKGDKYVTVIIDLTPVRGRRGPARLLDMVPGRSKQAFKDWLVGRAKEWADKIEVVAMDGFTGFKTAAAEELPDAVEVMDPFHVVHLAAEALDKCRQRVQQETRGHRGHKDDPLYKARRTLHTGWDIITRKQHAKLTALFFDDRHISVETTWAAYQECVAAYRAKDRTEGKKTMTELINKLASGVPHGLEELAKLGRTLKRRAPDILAYFDLPGTSNGPTEAINGRLEHLRGIGLGFRNLTNYIARALLETGGFKPKLLHP